MDVFDGVEIPVVRRQNLPDSMTSQFIPHVSDL